MSVLECIILNLFTKYYEQKFPFRIYYQLISRMYEFVGNTQPHSIITTISFSSHIRPGHVAKNQITELASS